LAGGTGASRAAGAACDGLAAESRAARARFRTAGGCGSVDATSALNQWLAWATDYAERSDPLKPIRGRSAGKLTLYYHGYDHDRIGQEGFKEPDLSPGWGNEKAKPGVELTTRPPRVRSYQRALKLELAEDTVLPYEWPQESDWYWRCFGCRQTRSTWQLRPT
jgi:hypothetical protein